jgi:gliding motility-associated-like protein
MKKGRLVLLIIFLSSNLLLQGQEICDNAIDDDGDGLIDLNDNDCICDALLPSSLIPNPSFEEMNCCPTANEMLECADYWIQASAPTTDYVHTCENYLGNTSIPAYAPLPFPDGEGAVGFRDGQEHAGINYKEYVGACLLEPMEVGVSYRLDFFVGFQDDVAGSKSFDIALFASTNCNNLPFGGNNYQIGCPVNTGYYVQLGETFVSGSNEWVNVVFEFTADQAYEVFVLGPSCSLNPQFYLDPYFYVDRLTLAKSTDFEVPLESVNGSICDNNLVLALEANPLNTYQWYQDGIAMIGQTSNSLLLTSIDNTEGTYTAMVTTPEGCYLSEQYNLLIPPYYETVDASICESEFFISGTDSLNTAGFHELWLEATDGCDSVLQVTLDVRLNSYASMLDTFCLGDEYVFHDIITTEAGTFETVLENSVGCDSLITIYLTGVGSGMGVELPQTQFLKLGENITLEPVFFDPIYTDFSWTDEMEQILSTTTSVTLTQPDHSQWLYLLASNNGICSRLDSLEIKVIPDYSVYIPNAFSPDGNGINDEFTCYITGAVESIVSFAVFDRWGNLVFQENDIPAVGNYNGWDGYIASEPAMQGVYAYMIKLKFLNGIEKLYSGDVTLVR